MGSIKKITKGNVETAHSLTEAEFNYVMNVNQAKQNIVQEYNRVISAFLQYVATNRLGYGGDTDLQFEMDFTDKDHVIKITKIPKEA